MTLFPKIARTCPYLDRLDTVIDDDFCRMCKRTVHDLTDMDRGERESFMAACGGDACVRYTAYVKPAVAAALVAASAAVLVMPEAAMAQHRHRPHVTRVKPPQPPVVPVMLAGAPLPIPMPPPEPPKPAEPTVAVKPD